MQDTRKHTAPKTPKIKFAFVPYELQREIIDYIDGKHLNKKGKPYRFFIAALGRQSGKSWLAKYVLLDHAINRNETCMWVAPVIPTARDHWNDLIALIEKSGIPIERRDMAAKEIIFKGGGSIRIRSAIEPDSLRGASPDLTVLDEAAFYRDGKYVWYSVISAMIISNGGKVLFTTTPNGRNWVHELFKKGLDPDNLFYKSWNVPSHVSPYADKDLLEEYRLSMPSLQYREEFLAEFLPDGGGIFAGIEQAAVVDAQPFPDPNADEERYVAGIDIGGNKDYTCFTVIDTLTRQQVFGERFTNIGTVRTIRRIIELLDLWKPKVTHIEKNGVGEHFVGLLKTVLSGADIDDIIEVINDTAEEDGDEPMKDYTVGRHKIKALHMNNEMKRNVVERVAADVEYKRLQILAEKAGSYGEVQVSEMSTFLRVPTDSGMGITYKAEEGNHDDTISALYLAYKGVKKLTKEDIMAIIRKKKQARNGEGSSSPFHAKSRPTGTKGTLSRKRRH